MKQQDEDARIRALGEHARMESSDALADAGWEAVAAGTATPDQRAALERAAELSGFDRAELRALFEPLGADSKARLLELARAELAGTSRSHPNQEAKAAPRGGRPRLLRFAGTALGAVALAASVALFVGRAHVGGGRSGSIPAYELTITGGDAELRGDPPELGTLTVGSRLVLTLRPASRVEGPLEARAYLVQDRRAYPLRLDATITAEGAVRLSGHLDELPGAPGPAELAVSVGRPGVPHDPLGAASPDTRNFRRPVTLGTSK